VNKINNLRTKPNERSLFNEISTLTQ